MNLFSSIMTNAGIVARAARGILQWSESVVPWPLSLLPRTARLPLDLVDSLLGDDATPSDETAAARARPPTSPAPSASTKARTDAPRKARESTSARGDHGTPPRRTSARTDHATATIAGTRGESSPPTADDREFRARQAPLYARVSGDGPALVLLHAFPLSSRMWEPQLSSLAGRFRVIAPDFAGFGLSPLPDGPASLEAQADAVAATLADLGVDEMILVGLSFGGYVAFPLLRRLRGRVRGLVLASTRAGADSDRVIDDRHRLAAEVEEEGVEVAAGELVPRLLGSTTARDVPELVDHVNALVLENKPAGLAAALRAMAARPDSTHELGRIPCPVLVIAGDEDEVVSASVARKMAGKIADARVVVLRAGHLVNLEAPADFDRAVTDLAHSCLRSHPQGSARRARAAHR